LALVHLECGDLDHAQPLVEEAARRDPGDKKLQDALPIVRSETGFRCRLLRTFTGHTDEVSAACITSDGRHIWSGGADQTVRKWNIETGECVDSVPAQGRVCAMALSADQRYLAWGVDSDLVWLSNLRTKGLTALKGHAGKDISERYHAGHRHPDGLLRGV
jgi:WD40 repeat protein